jgi:nucleotide-binding universal stress UspA family protein
MSQSPFRRILVPVDFTEEADVALHSGFEAELEGGKVGVASASIKSLELAAALVDDQGELRLVHATPTYESARIYNSGLSILGNNTVEEIHEAARKASTDALEQLTARFAPKARCSYVVKPGIAVTTILEEAESFDAELIVVAASGRNRVSRFFLGSTADRVIREATCPVLVVPPAVLQAT